MNTNISELLQLKKQYDDDNKLLQALEKNPMSEGQLNDILGRGRSSIEFATIQKRLSPLLDELREYELFSQSFKRSNEQMISGEDSRNWTGFKVYQDLPMDVIGQGFKAVQPYMYVQNGRKYTSGAGFTAKSPLMLINAQGTGRISAEDRQKFNEAEKIYDRSRKEIDSIFRDLALNTVPEKERQY